MNAADFLLWVGYAPALRTQDIKPAVIALQHIFRPVVRPCSRCAVALIRIKIHAAGHDAAIQPFPVHLHIQLASKIRKHWKHDHTASLVISITLRDMKDIFLEIAVKRSANDRARKVVQPILRIFAAFQRSIARPSQEQHKKLLRGWQAFRGPELET